ncbi:XRE family transcriptional regulator [Novosphingobium sp. Leaf2]|nr:XRE family transcriptional regulator [Novosphingobium sp. Leaf2]
MSRSVFSEPYGAFLQALIEGRRTAQLRQVDLADRLGKPQSFVSKYENGERRLDVVEFLAIAKLLGLDPHNLIDRLSASVDAGSDI